MTRSEALEEFREKYCRDTDKLTEIFTSGLKDGTDMLMGRILKAFGQIADQAGAQEKGACVFFLFSLLRYDLLSDTARVRLDVTDGSWYLDEMPLHTEFDLTFLFAPYFKRREELLTAMRPYMGKVNRYDVFHIVQEEIMDACRILTQYLRILFRSIETQEEFRRIPKLSFWEISFGEYRDQREVVLQVNREIRDEEEWKKKLEDVKEDPGLLQFGWWYQARLTGGDCSQMRLEHAAFEECILKDINFGAAKMTGVRFLRCRLTGCSFRQTDLTQAEFEGCVFTDCDFSEALLQQAVFSPEGLEAGWFDEKQKEEMLVMEGVGA